MAQTTTTQNNIPAFLEQPTQDLINRGEALSRTPYQPYQGQRVQEFSDQQLQGFGATGQYAGAGQAEQGIGALLSLQSTNPAHQGVQDYINPFVQNALDPAAQDIERAYLKDLNRIGGQAGSLGAWGSRSQGVLPGVAQRNFLEATGDLYSQGYAGAYDRGINALQSDQDRTLQAGGQISNIGAQSQGLGLQGADALLRSGNLQQAQGQAGLDVGYQNYQENQQWPYNNLNFLSGLITGAPGSTTQTTSQPDPNGFAQIAGAGLGILGLGQSFDLF